MSTEVFTVKPDATLERVASQMAAKKYGCAVVTEDAKVLGVFTTTDLALAFAEVLRAFKPQAKPRPS